MPQGWVFAGMDRILVSACLLGQSVRYDGRAKTLRDDLLDKWRPEGRLVSICPEVMAGMPTPRPPAEMMFDGRVIDKTGRDVSASFHAGAQMALNTALDNKCRFALLTDGSPSCGSSFIYDGSFVGRKISGVGIVTAMLQKNGIQVYSEHQIQDLMLAVT